MLQSLLALELLLLLLALLISLPLLLQDSMGLLLGLLPCLLLLFQHLQPGILLLKDDAPVPGMQRLLKRASQILRSQHASLSYMPAQASLADPAQPACIIVIHACSSEPRRSCAASTHHCHTWQAGSNPRSLTIHVVHVVLQTACVSVIQVIQDTL